MHGSSDGGLSVKELVVHEGALVRFDGVLLRAVRLSVDTVQVSVLSASGSAECALGVGEEITLTRRWRLVSTLPVVRRPVGLAGEGPMDAVAHFCVVEDAPLP